MRKLVIILSLFLPFFLYSQEKLLYSEVIEVPGIDKSELFIRGREWLNENFKSAKDVLQIQDKETGELAVKGVMTIHYTYQFMGVKRDDTPINFQLNIWVKDGKYKFEMTSFKETEYGFGILSESNEAGVKISGLSQKKANEVYLSIKNSTIVTVTQLINDLKIKMSKSSKSNEW